VGVSDVQQSNAVNPYVTEVATKYCCCGCVNPRTGTIIFGAVGIPFSAWYWYFVYLPQSSLITMTILGLVGAIGMIVGAVTYNLVLVRVVQVYSIIVCLAHFGFCIWLLVRTLERCSNDDDGCWIWWLTVMVYLFLVGPPLFLNVWSCVVVTYLASALQRAKQYGVPPPAPKCCA